MILIKDNVEKIVDDASQGVIDQLLHDGWSEVPVTADPKPKKKRTGSGVKKDVQIG